MYKVLILSNGHGEDLSGSLLGKKLIELGHEVSALPIVGKGNCYKTKGIKIIGETKEFNTGGLGYNSFRGKLEDMFNGQIIYFFKKLFLTFQNRNEYDFFLVVGDIVPILFSWISSKNCFVYLVAYSSHYEGKLKLPWPCMFFLKSTKVKQIYSRDHLTAEDLSTQLKKQVKFLGNPFMDSLVLDEKFNSNIQKNSVALLPGSRIPEVENNFSLLLDFLEKISEYKYSQNIVFNFALINSLKMDKVLKILENRNWDLSRKGCSSKGFHLKYKFICVGFNWNSFEGLLSQSVLVVGMAGTALEQAVGLAKPVVQIEGNGPQFTKSFAEAQRRLLGETVFCSTKHTNKYDQIAETINIFFKVLYLLKLDKHFLLTCERNASKRLGTSDACIRLIEDIIKEVDYEK